MKDLFKKITKPFLIISLLMLFSCEKDLYDEPIKKHQIVNMSVEMKEVNKNSEVISKLKKKFPSKFVISPYAKGADTLLTLEGAFGKVKLDNVIELSNSGKKAFTFEIDESVKSPNVYLNLVIDNKGVVWLYKIDKIVQQYKDYPINSERLVKYKLNNDLTQQSSTPCDTIIYPPFEPDPVPSTGNSIPGTGGIPGEGHWQNTPPSGGFFPPIVIGTPGGSTTSGGTTSGGSNSGGSSNDGPSALAIAADAIGDAVSDAWNWFLNLFHHIPCGCHKDGNVVIIDIPDNPCDEGGFITIFPQSPVLDKIYLLDNLLGNNQLGYDNKQYFWNNNGLYLDYFIDLAQNPPANYNYYEILPNLITHVRTTGDFEYVQWANEYLISHPTVTMDEFKNQFEDTVEGKDGDYDATYWDNPALTFPSQNLPSWANFQNAFPLDTDPLYNTPQKMYNSIGGTVATLYTGPNTNTCAIRMSKALNYSGIIIPNIPGQTFKGADNKYYFKSAYQINLWMRKTFGTNPATSSTPYNANHHQYTQTQAGVHGVNLPALLNGIHGIYSIYSSNFNWATGHADLLNSNSTCGNHCLFYEAPILRLDVWELN